MILEEHTRSRLPGTARNAGLIKEPRRFLSEFLGLLLQSPLLERTVTKEILIVWCCHGNCALARKV